MLTMSDVESTSEIDACFKFLSLNLSISAEENFLSSKNKILLPNGFNKLTKQDPIFPNPIIPIFTF